MDVNYFYWIIYGFNCNFDFIYSYDRGWYENFNKYLG